MGNIFRGARKNGKLPHSSANDGRDVDKSGGGRGIEGRELEASSSPDTGGAASANGANLSPREETKLPKCSSKVVLENRTDKVMVLRERIRTTNGIVRHQIAGGTSIAIDVIPHHTYYRLLVYAVEAQANNSEGAGCFKTEDTGLTIDSDKLCEGQHIVISKDEASGKFILS